MAFKHTKTPKTGPKPDKAKIRLQHAIKRMMKKHPPTVD